MTEQDFRTAMEIGREISFSEEATAAERTINAAWLAEALKSSATIHLEHAIISGSIVLQGSTISAALLCSQCQFDGVVATYCTFETWVVLDRCKLTIVEFRGSTFKSALWIRGSELERLDVGYVDIQKDLDLDKTAFTSRFYAAGVRVRANLHARDSRFLGKVIMDNATIEGQADFKGTVFAEHVILHDSKLQALVLENALFAAAAEFDRLDVRGSLVASNTFFGDVASFSGARFQGQFRLIECTFRSTSILESLQVDAAFLIQTHFYGLATFLGTKLSSMTCVETIFGGRCEMHELTASVAIAFKGVKFVGGAFFERMTVGTSVVVEKNNERSCNFLDTLSFAGTIIHQQLVCEDARVVGASVFESVIVGADLLLNRGSFSELVSIVGSNIGGNLDLADSNFKGLDLTNSVVSGHALLWKATFSGMPTLVRTRINSTLNFSTTSLASGVRIDGSEVLGRTIFVGSKMKGTLSARMASLRILLLDEESDSANAAGPWPFDTVSFDVSGLTYERIEVRWRPFLRALESSPQASLDRQPFLEFEKALRRMGRDDWANDVHYSGRKQSARVYRRFSLEAVSDCLVRIISGYGVRPTRLIAAISILAIIASALFLVPGAARPTTIASARYRCDRSPAVFQALSLGTSVLVPGSSKIVDGWTISDCPLTQARIKPFTIVGILQLVGLCLIPFCLTQISSSLRYSSRQ